MGPSRRARSVGLLVANEGSIVFQARAAWAFSSTVRTGYVLIPLRGRDDVRYGLQQGEHCLGLSDPGMVRQRLQWFNAVGREGGLEQSGWCSVLQPLEEQAAKELHQLPSAWVPGNTVRSGSSYSQTHFTPTSQSLLTPSRAGLYFRLSLASKIRALHNPSSPDGFPFWFAAQPPYCSYIGR